MFKKIFTSAVLMLGLIAVALPISAESLLSETGIEVRLAPCIHCGKAGVQPPSTSRRIDTAHERVSCIHGMTGIDDKTTWEDQEGSLCIYCGNYSWRTIATYYEYCHLLP